MKQQGANSYYQVSDTEALWDKQRQASNKKRKDSADLRAKLKLQHEKQVAEAKQEQAQQQNILDADDYFRCFTRLY
jgi:hypothetical protein